jgi:hypothetical protein
MSARRASLHRHDTSLDADLGQSLTAIHPSWSLDCLCLLVRRVPVQAFLATGFRLSLDRPRPGWLVPQECRLRVCQPNWPLRQHATSGLATNRPGGLSALHFTSILGV